MRSPSRSDLRIARLVAGMAVAFQAELSSAALSRIRNLLAVADQLRLVHRRLEFCHQRRWATAAQSLRERESYLLQALLVEEAAFRALHEQDRHRDAPTLRDALAELRQICDEFGDYTPAPGSPGNPGNLILSVKTDPITLEGVELGRFEIQLDLKKLLARHGHTYQVVALDPNPPTNDDTVTHPHVRDGQLCEGEAAAPIRRALEQGRLCEFFLLVRSVLTTYNSNSPYVRLEHWHGTACHDCGCVVDGDDLYYCEPCGHDYCDGCFSCCRSCDTSACRACIEVCPGCDDATCSGCLQACAGCGKHHCGDCLDDDLCPTCHQKQQEESNDDQNPSEEKDRPGGGQSEPANPVARTATSAAALA